jgi:hypothetical protein
MRWNAGALGTRTVVYASATFLTFALGCSRPTGLPEIEKVLADQRVVQMAPGDPCALGVPKVILVNRYWHDSPQILDKNGDGNLAYSFVSQVGMSVESVGDWQTVIELIHDRLESSDVTAEELFRHRDDRVRFATYFTLGQYSPISDHFPNSSDRIVAELAQIASSKNVYEAAEAIDLLSRSRIHSQNAFQGAVSHPCAQIRLAAILDVANGKLTDDEMKEVLPHLVTCLGDRDTVVRESAYSTISLFVTRWQRLVDSGGALPDDVAAMIKTVPSRSENANWYREVSMPFTESLQERQVEWDQWLASHGL